MKKVMKYLMAVMAVMGSATTLHAQYTISVAKAQNCTVSWTPEEYSEGEMITVTLTPNQGCVFKEDGFEVYYECTEDEWWEAQSSSARRRLAPAPRRASSFAYRLKIWYLDGHDDDPVEVTEGAVYTFTMPARNVELEASFIADDTPFAITTTQMPNGTTTVPNTAVVGTEVTIEANPSTGYMVDEVKVYEREIDGNTAYETSIDYTETDDTHFTFIMPANPVRVEVTYRLIPTLIELVDDADNSALISKNVGVTTTVQLTGRTLWKDGGWNTLCLPFNAPLEGDLAGAELRELSSASVSGSTLTLNFIAAESIVAGKPYIIKWTSGNIVGGDLQSVGGDLQSPTFSGVTITSTAPTDVDKGVVTFKGTYDPITIAGEDNTKLFMAAENTLYYPDGTAPTYINACRAYFQLNNGLTAGAISPDDPSGEQAPVRAFVLNFDDTITTGISTQPILRSAEGRLLPTGRKNSPLSARPKDACYQRDARTLNSTWYTLDGRKLSGQSTQSGVYLHNGKKIIIK